MHRSSRPDGFLDELAAQRLRPNFWHPQARIRQGVAKDRRISIEDPQMRHGRKTKSRRVDGYKRHVLCDLDTELVCAVGVTAANLPEAQVADQITADLDAQGLTLGELEIDRA